MTIMYLDENDFNQDMLTFPEAQYKTVIMFVMSDNCIYCKQVKPVFEQFAKTNPTVFCAYVDVNDPRGQILLKKMQYRIQGVPDFLKFVKGKRVKQQIRGRTLNDFIAFSKMY